MSTRSSRSPSASVLGVSSLVQLEGEAASDGQLSQMVYDYYASGADCQATLEDNRASFARYKLLPRMLRDVSTVDMTTSLFGTGPSSKARPHPQPPPAPCLDQQVRQHHFQTSSLLGPAHVNAKPRVQAARWTGQSS